MKVLTNWLKEFVPFEASADEIAALLSRLGFEIAALQKFGGNISGVVIAQVQDVQKHPNADRLSICKVFDGQNTFPVVCGAANVRADIKVPFARVGATLPNGMTLKAAKLRGVESQGMICSSSELGLEEKSEGIMILPESAPIGGDAKTFLGLDDALIEIETTPNRRDALSILGVAREVAAGLGLPLKMPEPRSRELDLPQSVPVTNSALDRCPRYIARTIREIRVGPSPAWMVQRLTRCGIRSINNIVDITNYVMLELGQPMHAFDVQKLNGRQLHVRRAQNGETLLTLDGKTLTLKDTMLVIADEKWPVALAGIIGGEESSITDNTTEIVLESAAFDPAPIRLTRKEVGIATESSYRFERGTDWNMVALASRRAAQLVQELAGGGIACKPVEKSAPPPVPPTVKLRSERMRQFLGVDIKESVAADILRRLGCVINSGTGQLAVTVPSWRLDISIEADLMEEVSRLYGYDNIPSRLPAISQTAVPDDPLWPFERRLAAALQGFGFSEAFNYSFLSEKQMALFIPGFGQSAETVPVRIANPMTVDQTLLRTSPLPSLLQNVAHNFRHEASGAKLFELTRIFGEDLQGRHESRRLGVVLAGEIHTAHWREKTRRADFYDLAGMVEALLGSLHIARFELIRYPLGPFHPKQSCVIMAGTRTVGWMGTVHPDLVQKFDLPEDAVAAELDVQALQQAAMEMIVFQPLASLPPVHRDLSFVVPEDTSYERIVKALRAAAGPVLDQVTPIDVFASDKIGGGKKSMTISLVFRQPDRTLNDAEIEAVTKKIISDLERKCEAVLRQ